MLVCAALWLWCIVGGFFFIAYPLLVLRPVPEATGLFETVVVLLVVVVVTVDVYVKLIPGGPMNRDSESNKNERLTNRIDPCFKGHCCCLISTSYRSFVLTLWHRSTGLVRNSFRLCLLCLCCLSWCGLMSRNFASSYWSSSASNVEVVSGWPRPCRHCSASWTQSPAVEWELALAGLYRRADKLCAWL